MKAKHGVQLVAAIPESYANFFLLVFPRNVNSMVCI